MLDPTSIIYHAHPSRANKNKLTAAKKSIDEAYLQAEADNINGKISDISKFHISRQHSAAWKTIGDLTGKDSKPKRPKGWKIGLHTSKTFWVNHLTYPAIAPCLKFISPIS